MGIVSPSNFPNSLKDRLEVPNLKACVVQIGTDLARLRALGVDIKRRSELRQLAVAHHFNQDAGTSMAALCRRYLWMNVDKSGQNADYSQDPLPTDLAKYGALDALLSRKLAETLSDLVAVKGPTDCVFDVPNHTDMDVGATVDIYIGGKHAATATVIYVGGINGESKKFNSLLVSKGKAIVCLKKVFVQGARPPFRNYKATWPKTVTLGWIFFHDSDREIYVGTSNLAVPLQERSHSTIPQYFDY